MDIVFVVASNSEPTLRDNLRRSPLIASGRFGLHVERDAASASIAYNRAIDATAAPVIVFLHQDIYLPQGWDAVLASRLAEIAAADPDWGLMGSYGVLRDGTGIGPIWSSSLGMIVGRVPLAPVAVEAFDEALIVLRRASGLRFDAALPGWHMYGTDIVQQALGRGMGAWAVGLPCIHNDKYHDTLHDDFSDAYRYMQRKWAAILPIQTPVTKVSRHGLHLWRNRRVLRRTADQRMDMVTTTATDPALIAERCGWSVLAE